MKIISMTDFVLDQQNKSDSMGNSYWKCTRYANFLKQPLTLGMFVPCDADGNVLQEPKIENDHNGSFFKMQTDFQKEKEYQDALDRVMFSDFKLERKPFEDFDYIKTENMFVFKKYCTMKHWSINTKLKNKTVEDLIKYNLVLTESAKKQIGILI